MPDIDPSIPLRAGANVPQPLNPLATYGNFVGLQNALNTQSLFPLQEQVMQNQVRQQELAIQDAQLKQQVARNQWAMGAMLPLLFTPDGKPTSGVTSGQVRDALVGGLTGNIMSAEDSVQVLKQFGDDPAANRARMIQMYSAVETMNQRAAQTLGLLGGSPIQIDTGPEVVGGKQAGALTVAPGAIGAQAEGTGVQRYPSRSELAGQVAGAPTEAGAPTQETMLQRLQRQRSGNLAPPALRGEGVQPAQTGAAPVAPAIQGMPQPAAPVASGPAIVGNAPGTEQAAGAMAQAGTNLIGRADQVPANKANYATMLADIEQLKTMGPGTAQETKINALLQKLTGYGITMDKNQVASAESFNKIANQLAQAQAGALGATDQRERTAMGANPNIDMSKLGVKRVIAMLNGNEDAITAKARAWQEAQNNGMTPGQYNKFSTEFNKNFDPRVFQVRYMTQDEIQHMRKSMSPRERTEFLDKYEHATKNGWLQ